MNFVASNATIADVIPSIILMKQSLVELRTAVTTNGQILINLLIQELNTRFDFELNSPLFKASL